MSRRLGVLLAVGGILLAIIGIGFFALILRQTMAPAAVPTQPPPPSVAVVVSTRALPVRALIKAQDVTLVNMPVEFAPLEAVDDINDVVGKISKIPLAAGEIVMAHHLADPTNISRDFAFIIDEDQVLLAFPATDLMSQVDVLQPGDLVDILFSAEVPVRPDETTPLGGEATGADTQDEDELFTFDALQRVTVQAIVVEITQERTSGTSSSSTRAGIAGTPQPTPTPAPAEIRAQAILVAVSPQDALVLKHLNDRGGTFDIVLRAPTSRQTFELDPVSAEYLKDRYGLVIER